MTIIENGIMQCQVGMLRLGSLLLDRPQANVDFSYEQTSGAINYSLKKVALAKGTLNISGAFDKTGWRMKSEARGMEVAALPGLLKGVMRWPAGYSQTGTLNLAAELAGQEKQLRGMELRGTLGSLSFSDAKGLMAGEKLAADFDLRGQAVSAGWKFQGTLSPRAGQLYVDPVFQDFTGQVVKLNANGVWDNKRGRLTLSNMKLEHKDVVGAQASLELDLNPLKLSGAAVKLSTSQLGLFYEAYLQKLLAGKPLDSLEGEGTLDMQLDYHNEKIASLRASLKDVSLQDKNGRFGFGGVNGEIAWSRDPTPLLSTVRWDQGELYGLALGSSQIKLRSQGAKATLVESTAIPVLDGSLQIDSLSTAHLGTPEAEWQLGGGLTPVSMESFSAALGWPMMSGKISGVIPLISYARGKLEISGAVLMRVFDGQVVVRDLQIERPFGVAPVLSAEVDMDNLDLETLTRTFSFGKIEGRLDGRIKNLRMANWRPVSFDAKFATPDEDDSRHRISQKAVDSLSSLGGVEAALSRTFLRFFDDFSYAELGISCRLENEVCTMDGIAPAKQGYYIVKGGGLPRIDVVGYATKVDWPVLVVRLRRITSEKPIVE
jgi:hypothetical protein